MAFEESYVSFSDYSVLEEIIEESSLAPVSGMIEALREVKDESEIALIQQACHIADQGFEHILKMIRPGMSEIEVANQLDFSCVLWALQAFLLIQSLPVDYVQLCPMG